MNPTASPAARKFAAIALGRIADIEKGVGPTTLLPARTVAVRV
jgi:hypothetical protein